MTGTRVEIERVTCNKEMKTNRVLAETFYEEMKKIPTPVYTEDEIAFAAEISKEAGFENHGEYFAGLEPLEDQPVSTGNRNGRVRCEPYCSDDHAQCGSHV